MHRQTPTTTQLAHCDSCGRPPEPGKTRLALVKLSAVLPLELGLHLLVLWFHPPYPVSALLLAASSTVLAMWVFEPAAARALGAWLHAPTRAGTRRLHEAASLWRVRVTVPDRPGALERLAHGFAAHDLNVLGVHAHTLADRVLDEFVVAAPLHLAAEDLERVVTAAGGSQVHVWPTTALALADGQTRALTVAARVAADPDELPMALAELLGAVVRPAAPAGTADDPEDMTLQTTPLQETSLRVLVPDGEPVILDRPGEPFTPAEAARAHRLAQLTRAAPRPEAAQTCCSRRESPL